MKIYTEIIWSWDDDKGELVQESSKSYDYDGPLTLAHQGEKHQTKYLQYPSTIGSAVKHWISFSAFSSAIVLASCLARIFSWRSWLSRIAGSGGGAFGLEKIAPMLIKYP